MPSAAATRGNNKTGEHLLSVWSSRVPLPRAGDSARFPSQEPTARKSTVSFWAVMALVVALGLAATALGVNGTDPDGLRVALRLTGRWSFLLFWLAYAGGAMAELGGPSLAALAGRGREFGLAYAAAQLIHMGLVIRFYQITSRLPLSAKPFVLFTIGIFWTYLLAVFSVGGLSKVLGSRGWRMLRITGLNYILFVFAIDFVPIAISGASHGRVERLVAYVPFAVMCVAAPLLVLAAAAHRQLRMRYNRTGFVQAMN